MPTIDEFSAAQFVLLTTFRRDGRPVPTAVWAVPLDDGEIGVWTVAESGKIKRIRRDGHVELAECDRRGTPLGPAVQATARLLDTAATQALVPLIRAKYGLLGRVLTTVSRLRRGPEGAAGIAVRLGP